VIQRGNNRTPIFKDSAHYQVFLSLLRSAAERKRVTVHGYVLMTTHYHLVVTPSMPDSLPRMMKDLGIRYVRYFNGEADRIGTLWNGRYRGLIIEDESYLLTCLRYVEQNPVRAGMVSTPDDYPWSSYAAHAHGKWPDWLTPHPLYQSLGVNQYERQRAYQVICGTQVTDGEVVLIR
jgi:putative transposase